VTKSRQHIFYWEVGHDKFEILGTRELCASTLNLPQSALRREMNDASRTTVV
jgi:hypothetical protein